MQGVAGGEEEKRGEGEGQEPRGGAKGRRNTSPDERAAERRFKTPAGTAVGVVVVAAIRGEGGRADGHKFENRWQKRRRRRKRERVELLITYEV